MTGRSAQAKEISAITTTRLVIPGGVPAILKFECMAKFTPVYIIFKYEEPDPSKRDLVFYGSSDQTHTLPDIENHMVTRKNPKMVMIQVPGFIQKERKTHEL